MQEKSNTTLMPSIIYGTAWKKEQTTRLVLDALEAGFRGIDTACQPKHYSEALVGDAIVLSGIDRRDLYIQTKFTPVEGHDPNTIPYDKDASLFEQVLQSFEVSKQNLKSDYVDALILHSPLFPFSNLLEVWRAMEKIYETDGAKMLGISNCYDLSVLKRLYDEARIKPSIVQNRFYEQSDYDTELRQWCKEHHIAYESFWSLTANPHILNSDTIIKLAIKYRKTQPQIFFAYLISQGITPLSGTTSKEHMSEDLEANKIVLEREEIEQISSLLRH
ncbi:aldo/keto reductase [Sulfurovum sp. zt1-1]|uniref:Aldo/keto reductase n=1 Tax=Sulfurovum zhangzhouensis TaxID=3019067 RepID=A0ABT7QVH4_9BACT|nr:aldo/keto reductase [Sulfurovum zhangzhouensis]MDM5270844.1 aldo/keto reductase [Sulfurovum zhangzhouensis]